VSSASSPTASGSANQAAGRTRFRLRLSRHAFVTFWDVHAWSGVLCALILHLLFFFGAFTLFQDEIKVWEDPLLQQGEPARVTEHEVAALVDRYVPRDTSAIESFSVFLGDPVRIAYQARGAEEVELRLHSQTGLTSPDRAYMAQWLDDLHSLSIEQASWLERIAGLACVLLGLALVTGILIHLKDLVRQLFQLRTGKGMKVLWSDLHKLTGVWGLPFLLLFAWTGALLNLDDWLENGVRRSHFANDSHAADVALSGKTETAAPEVQAQRSIPIADLVARARRELPGVTPRFFFFEGVDRGPGSLEVFGSQAGVFQGESRVKLSIGDGSVLHLHRAGVDETRWQVARRWLYELHYAAYGGPGPLGILVRGLYAAFALASCVALLTGNWIWLARRDEKRRHWGNRLLARLTIGFGAGLSLALAVLFIACRLLPLDLPDRTAYEVVFFASWGLALLWAFIPRQERAGWWQQLGAASVLFATAPVLALWHSSAGLLGRLWPGDAPASPAAIGIDLMLLLCAFACGLAALRIRRVSGATS
jgi:uncharacterized iron-regulated membrane protein